MSHASQPVVTVAIPICQQRVSPLLDTAMRLLVATCRNRQEISRREILLGPLSTGDLAHSVAELRVDVLLCGALSLELQHALEHHGVRVWPHLCGEVDEVLKAFGCGRLARDQFHIPGCHCGYGCQRRPEPARCRSPRHRTRTIPPIKLRSQSNSS